MQGRAPFCDAQKWWAAQIDRVALASSAPSAHPTSDEVSLLTFDQHRSCKRCSQQPHTREMTSTSAAAVVLLAALALLSPGIVDAWGGLFNRFSPEILSNLGYGGRAGPYKPQPFLQVKTARISCLFLEFAPAATQN